jgi:integrase/recombinase XerD
VNNPELNNLPPIKLIPLNAETTSLPGRTASTRPPTDIRWVKVLEFLRSNNLAPNSRKLYERELKRFLAWSELHSVNQKVFPCIAIAMHTAGITNK